MTIKKLAAFGMALGMAAVSFSGCGSKTPETSATYNGGSIPAGVYIFNQFNAMNEAYQKVANPTAIFSLRISTVPMPSNGLTTAP